MGMLTDPTDDIYCSHDGNDVTTKKNANAYIIVTFNNFAKIKKSGYFVMPRSIFHCLSKKNICVRYMKEVIESYVFLTDNQVWTNSADSDRTA